MSTDLTPNLSLVKPNRDEPMPSWPGQMDSNLDKLDKMLNYSYGSYTPEWLARTTNPVLGSGNDLIGQYLRVGPKLVHLWVALRLTENTFSAGDGIYSLTLPFDIDPTFQTPSNTSGEGTVIGTMYLWDTSNPSDNNIGVCQLEIRQTKPAFWVLVQSTLAWTPTTPFTLNTDLFYMYGVYLTDAAIDASPAGV